MAAKDVQLMISLHSYMLLFPTYNTEQGRWKATKDGAAIDRIIEDAQLSKVYLHEVRKHFSLILSSCTFACI